MPKKQKSKHSVAYYKDPSNSVGYLCSFVSRRFTWLLERKTLEYDVSAGQWRFLRQLWRTDGMTQRELSDVVGMRESSTVIALKGLERVNLIYREKSLVDRRKVHVFLTAEGKALENKLTPFNADVHEIVRRGFSEEEMELLLSLLRRVANNLGEEVQLIESQIRASKQGPELFDQS